MQRDRLLDLQLRTPRFLFWDTKSQQIQLSVWETRAAAGEKKKKKKILKPRVKHFLERWTGDVFA